MGNVIRRAVLDALALADDAGGHVLVAGKGVHHAVVQGRRSDGCCSCKGNGGLALSKQALFFVMAAPRRVDAIPLTAMRGVRADTHFKGSCSDRRTVVIVDFVNDAGREDAIGFVLLSCSAAQFASALQGEVERARGAGVTTRDDGGHEQHGSC